MDTKELLKKVRKIEIKTRRLSDHIFGGEYHSTFKGRGMTFSEVRQYQFGDDVRSIDWNVTARYNEPFIKVFEEERELTMMLMVDISGSEWFGTDEQFKNEIVTPKLTGSILPGVTRASVIQILKDRGLNITERLLSIDEVVEEYKKGNVLGAFGTGTAAVISPVGSFTYKDFEMKFDTNNPDYIAQSLFDELTSIHYGKIEDKHNWLTWVERKPIEA